MTKKSIHKIRLSMTSFQYTPAKLIDTNPNKWYILFYQTNPLTGIKERFRPTHDLNRIKDPHQRLEMAIKVITQINSLLPSGYPYLNNPYQSTTHLSLIQAIHKALDLKVKSMTRRDSINSYSSIANTFISYIEKNHLDKYHVRDFNRVQAFHFLDTIDRQKKLASVSYNNYITALSSLFNVLVDRQIIDTNPFSKIQRKRAEQKKRRQFTDYEKQVIYQAVKESQPLLFVAILLIQFCGIRPRELTRLKARDIDLEKSMISISGQQAKNLKTSTVTIPSFVIPFLIEAQIPNINKDHFIFGKGLQPHPTQKASKNLMNSRHRTIIEKLHKKKILDNIEGLSLYSWKDTGAVDMIQSGIDIVSLKNQFRHSSLDYTQRYIQRMTKTDPTIEKMKVNFNLPSINSDDQK